MKHGKVLGWLVCLSFAFASAMAAQQKDDEKVVCPVSGKTMLKSQAPASYEYEGKTYYFCCEGAKEKFSKDPAKYIAKKAEVADVYTCPMHPEVKSDKAGKCPKCGMNLEKKAMPAAHCQGAMHMKEMGACPMMGVMGLKDVSLVSENLTDGIVIKITAKDPETVKKIQELGVEIIAMHKKK